MEVVTPYWFTRLDRLWRFGRIWLGILVFLLLTLLFVAMFGIQGDTDNTEEARGLLGICLFFASINATALVGTMAIIERSQLTIDQLKPMLGTDSERFVATRTALSGAPRKWLWSVTFISLAAGLLHTLTVNSANAEASFNVPSAGASLGTMLTWFIQLHAIAALVRTAHLFTQLGRDDLTLDVLRPEQLAPFGKQALLPSLLLMGTQLYYPLLSLSGQFNAYATLPGFVLTLLSAIYLLLRPIWPVHVHMREAKASLLASTDVGIARWREDNPDRNFTGSATGNLVTILTFRNHVRALPEWPLNLGLVGRWLFYIVIPPLTWAMAALMENSINAFLG